MRIGITGTNFVSDYFMRASSLVPQIEVTAVTSGHYENALAFQKKYSIQNVYHDLAEMLDSGTVDAIYLGVPNSMHAPLTLQCLRHHMPVITEKPFAASLKEAEQMIRVSKEENTYVHDAIVPLYTDHFALLKASLPKVGKIRRAVFSFSKYSSRYDAYLAGKNPTTFRSDLCNGSWMDLGIYCLSDCIGLFGSPKKIQASGVLLDTGADCQGSAIFTYDGFDAVLLHSKVTDTKIMSEIEGEEGTLQFDVPSLIKTIWFTDRHTGKTEQLCEPDDRSFACQLRDFVHSNETGLMESALVPHALTLQIAEILEQCRHQSGVIYPCDSRKEDL